jgi:branched-chain amino acid transport system permease protein
VSGYLEGVLVVLAINIILAYAAFLSMVAGQLNLGIAGFMAAGAYVSAYLTNAHAWLPVPAALAATGLTALLALVVAFPILRTRGIYLALATFAFGQVVQATILNLDVVGGAAGYPVKAFLGFPVVAVIAAAVFVAVYLLFHTRFGISVTAVRDDELVADQMGLSVRWLQTSAFTIGSAIAGLAGALQAHHFSYIEAQGFNVLLSIYVVLYVLLGGTQTIFGPLLGAAVFTLLPELLRGAAQWRYVIFACLILALMSWRPQGVVTRDLVRRLLEWRRPSAAGAT